MAAMVLVDPYFFGHPKTIRYRILMNSESAPMHLIALWAWAVRQKLLDGRLRLSRDSGMAIEGLLGHEAEDGRAIEAMLEAGFLDVEPDGILKIHDWKDWTGGRLARIRTQTSRKASRRRNYGHAWDKTRIAILQRDRFACVGCGSRAELDVHHIKPAGQCASPDEANADGNLVTLCERCHGLADSAHRATGPDVEKDRN